MKWLIPFMLFFAIPSFGFIRPAKIVSEIQEAIEDKDALLREADKDIGYLIQFTIMTLRDRGFNFEADNIEAEWELSYKGTLLNQSIRSIPDHPPIIAWLDTVMNVVIQKIGRPLCVSMHICDIYSLNKTIPVAINVLAKRCNFVVLPNQNMKDEHRVCMATDGVFIGLYPILTYWAITGASGFTFTSGLLATLGEKLMLMIAPGIADRVYENRC